MLILRSIGYSLLELPRVAGNFQQRISLLRTIVGALVLALLVGGVFFMTTRATNVNVLANGNFEQGFHMEPGCGAIGNSWHCFNNGGNAEYGFYDEQWVEVVADGIHGQLIEINTHNRQLPDHDRYAGIYQAVSVPAQAQCTVNLRGMIRTTKHGGDPWRYRVHFGTSNSGDWRNVTNWVDVGWDTYHERLEPGAFDSFTHSFITSSTSETIFIRFWKKWGIPEEEILLNLDSISLSCPSGGHAPTPVAYPTPTAYVYPTATTYTYIYPTPTTYIYPTAVPYVPPTATQYVYPTAVPVYPTAAPVYPTAAPYPTATPYIYPTAAPYVHPTVAPVQQPSGCTHIVRPGESLGWIAQDYDLTLHQVISANGIHNPDVIYIGQKLYIPVCTRYHTHPKPTQAPPTATYVPPPTATHIPPTATYYAPPTATHVPPTATYYAPPTATHAPPTATYYAPPTATHVPPTATHVPSTVLLPPTATPAACAGYYEHEGICYTEPWTGEPQYGCFVTVSGSTICLDPPAPTPGPTKTPYLILVTATPTIDPCECDHEDHTVTEPTATPYIAPTATPHVVPTATHYVAPSVTPSATPMPTTATSHMHRTYVVRSGNTLSQIAEHYGVSAYDLMHLNEIYNADNIYIGQVLLIPDR